MEELFSLLSVVSGQRTRSNGNQKASICSAFTSSSRCTETILIFMGVFAWELVIQKGRCNRVTADGVSTRLTNDFLLFLFQLHQLLLAGLLQFCKKLFQTWGQVRIPVVLLTCSDGFHVLI